MPTPPAVQKTIPATSSTPSKWKSRPRSVRLREQKGTQAKIARNPSDAAEPIAIESASLGSFVPA